MKEKEKELQQKYMEFQILEQQLKQIQQQIIALEQQLAELQTLEDSLTEISSLKKGADLFVPLGSGIFINTELKDQKSLLMNVGDNTILKKDVKDAKKVVTTQIGNIKTVMAQIEQEFQVILINNQSLKQDIQKLSSEIKAKQQ